MFVTPELEQLLSFIDQAIGQKYVRVEEIRRLSGSEENYRTIIREIDRVKAQLLYARADNAAATLTVREWLTILDRCEWKCAYCQKKPFQIMSHILPRREGGTTAENCLPACHSCLARSYRKNASPLSQER